MREYWNLLLFSFILLGAYFFFRNYDMQVKEGLENQGSSSSSNGIASNSDTYLTTIKDLNMKMKDQFNISQYRKSYEDIILGMDDLVSNIMLKTILSVDKNKPEESLLKLSQLSQSRNALNIVLKFVDKQ
jgi:uncharacterized membrane protein